MRSSPARPAAASRVPSGEKQIARMSLPGAANSRSSRPSVGVEDLHLVVESRRRQHPPVRTVSQGVNHLGRLGEVARAVLVGHIP